MESHDDNDSEQSMSTAAATLRHIEYVVMTLDHMSEQISDIRGIKEAWEGLKRASGPYHPTLITEPRPAGYRAASQTVGCPRKQVPGSRAASQTF